MSSDVNAPPGPEHRVVSREEWLDERSQLLAKEKAFTRLRDELGAERRALPWVKIEKEYTFDTPTGRRTLSDLFGGRSQLFIKHFMLGPGQRDICVGCSFELDHVIGILVHLEHHDVAYAAVSRAPIEEIEEVRKRMGWQMPWVSSSHSDFNYDFHVSFTPEEIAAKRAYYNFRWIDPKGTADLPGNSVFYKDATGQIYHTYSVFGRGGEDFLGAYRYLDVMPRGRNENGPAHSLTDWVRLHDEYSRSDGGSHSCGHHAR